MSSISKWFVALAASLILHLIGSAPLLWLKNRDRKPTPTKSTSITRVRVWNGAPTNPSVPRRSIVRRAKTIPRVTTLTSPLPSTVVVHDGSKSDVSNATSALSENGGAETKTDMGGIGGVAGSGASQTPGDFRLEELHRRLAAAAKRCYPPQAGRFHLQGSALLAFCLDDNGNARDARLVGETGYKLLDQAVLDCVMPQAAPLPPRPGCYRVPVEFRDSHGFQ